MSTTLEFFWHLSAPNKTARLDASAKLVGALEKFQLQHIPGDATDELERNNAPDVAYAIKRLVRGLASPRESSRLGFSVALTELLSRIDTVSAKHMLDLVLEASETTGSMKGHEERDMLFARLFGLTALAQSRLLVRDGLGTEEDLLRAVDILNALGSKKSWLREGAAWATARVMEALHGSSVSWRDSAAKLLVKKLLENEREWTPEKVALVILAQNWFPELKWKKLLAPTFKDSNVLASSNLATLSRILKEGSLEDDPELKAATNTSWKPQAHFVWDVIVDSVAPVDGKTRREETAPVQDLFRIVVDESFFASSASSERKYWGFLIFQKFANRVSPSDVPLLLTRNFMRTWMNHLSHADRYLHKIAKQVAQDVQKVASKDPRSGFALVLELLGRNGNRQFDQITRTKTVESILASMTSEGIREYIDHLLTQISEEDADSDLKSTQSKQLWVVDQLYALVRNAAVPRDDNSTKTILDFFALHGFFSVTKKYSKSEIVALRHAPRPPFTADLQQECRTRLLSALAELLSQTPKKKATGDNAPSTSKPGYSQAGELWISTVWKTLAELEKDTKHVSLSREWSEEDRELRTNVNAAVAQVSKHSAADRRELASGVELLFLGGLLQVLANDDQSSADDLKDCIEASQRMFAPAKPKSKKSKPKDEPSESADEPIDVFTNFLIGCLERGSAYTRTIATKAFEPLCGSLQESSIKLILSQLERRPVNAEEEEEDAEMDDGADLSDGEESNELDGQDGNGSAEDESEGDDDDVSESDSEGDDDEDDDEDEDDPDAELRSRIEEALRLSGIQPAQEDDSEEELMDDDQMMQLDEHLADVFKLRKSEKGGTKQNVNAQREATHFKNRVLDLVDIYVRRQGTSPHLPSIVLPLLDLVVGTGQDEKQLQEKTSGILRTRLGKSKDLPALQDPTEAVTVFRELHTRAKKARSGTVLAVVSQCCVYMARTLVHHGDVEIVSKLYGEGYKDYATRKSSPLNTAFFLDFARRLPGPAFNACGNLFEAIKSPHNFFRATELFKVFQVVTTQMSPEQIRQAVSDVWPSFRDALFTTISSACEQDPPPKPAQLRDVLKVGYAAMRQSKRAELSASAFDKLWDAPRLTKLAGTVTSSDRFQSAPALSTTLRQMLSLCSSSSTPGATKSGVNGAKRSAAEMESVDSKEVRKKVRKTKG